MWGCNDTQCARAWQLGFTVCVFWSPRTRQLLGMATGGGQIIRRLARKKMALPETAGTACFEYGVRVFV
jgi:hypothetical protein